MTGALPYCLLLIDDGRREALLRCIASLRHLPPWEQCVIVDDADHELGFAGAIRAGWERICQLDPRPPYVFHLETDFELRKVVPVAAMSSLLDTEARLAQVSLKRQPCNADEEAAGGIVEQHPDDFETRFHRGLIWTEHRRYFTTNPSLYRSSLCEHEWPQTEHSEGVFTHSLLAEGWTFAIWGSRFDPPRVLHVGERVGVGY